MSALLARPLPFSPLLEDEYSTIERLLYPRATMFTFCPLQGALSESTASQSLLELDGGVKVLIDVGWDESFDVEKLKELEKYVPLGVEGRRLCPTC